jgi:hypothetical protein
VTGAEIGSLLSVVVTGLIGLGVYLNSRKSNTNAEARNRADSDAQVFGTADAVFARIDEKVEAATAPLRARITALEAREDSTKTIVRRFFQRLVFWDTNGRVGPMPMPSATDMRDLDIEDLQPPT